MQDTESTLETELRSKLNRETAQIAWRELQTWFASGQVVQVSAELNLLDVAVAMANDQSELVKPWVESQMVGPVQDQQAAEWLDQDLMVWATVVRPFVLVQTVQPGPVSADS